MPLTKSLLKFGLKTQQQSTITHKKRSDFVNITHSRLEIIKIIEDLISNFIIYNTHGQKIYYKTETDISKFS